MTLGILALLSPIFTQHVQLPRQDSPSASDKAVLMEVASKCHLHEGALYFVQYDVPREPVIHSTRALGDTEAQMICALENLPKDFSFRFGLDVEAPPSRP